MRGGKVRGGDGVILSLTEDVTVLAKLVYRGSCQAPCFRSFRTCLLSFIVFFCVFFILVSFVSLLCKCRKKSRLHVHLFLFLLLLLLL